MSHATGDDVNDIRAKIASYVEHIEGVVSVFNQHAEELGLGVRLNAEALIAGVKVGNGLNRVLRFCDRADDSGVLHDSQLMTALNCVGELLTSPQNNGLVLGAMQSGKTTTSIALQFAGPIVYQLTGRRFYPIYLITSQTSQEDQTKIEINLFLEFYGELAVEVDSQHRCTIIEYVRQNLDPAFAFAPTIKMYREHVLQGALPDTMIGPRLDDFIQRRVKGDSIKRVADLCRRANSKNFTPLLIIDEPQYGASDRFVKGEDGDFERRPCVLLQIFNAIDKALGDSAADRVFIGLSATPYELHNIDAVWKVKQYLTSAYTGFNYFGGEVIDDGAQVAPPRTLSFADFGDEIGLPFLKYVNLPAYDAAPNQFARFADKIKYRGSQNNYRRQVEDTLRAAILHMAHAGGSTGICIRLFNNNLKSHRLLERLHLPKDQIDVIPYYGAEYKGQSVKRAIRQRQNHDLPFLVAVTNRARMGDAFPRDVRWFLEFSKKAANLNALLQGLLGRACGYGKESTVVMSAENAALVDDYQRSQGDYIYRTSQHSLIVGPYRRGAPTGLIRIRRDMDDPLIKKFFDRIDSEVVEQYIKQDSPNLSAKRRAKAAPRKGPILRIAEELGLFEHIETDAVREAFFPTYPAFEIARRGDEVPSSRQPDRMLKYSDDENGDCRFTFREWDGGANHGGVRSRGYGGRDAKDVEKAGDTLEPQINMRKFDKHTGEIIDDKRQDGHIVPAADRRPGNWRAEMVTLPLRAAVRELQAGESTFPVQHSPFADYMNEAERMQAGFS